MDSVRADLTKPDSVEEPAERIAGTARPIAAAAINAGVGIDGASVGETELDDHYVWSISTSVPQYTA